MSRIGKTVVAAGLALLAGAVPGAGEDAPAGSRARPFTAAAEVVRIDVPVTVTDRRGEPVRGLVADDFVLLDRGRRRPLSAFDVVDLHTVELDERQPRETLPAVARRHFLFLFDFSFSSRAAILRARQAAREIVLHHLHPTDLAAVAFYSLESGPELVLTFTPDRAALARAIDNLSFERRRPATADPLRFIPAAVEETLAGGPGETSDRETIRAQIEATGIESARVVGRQMERGQLAYERSRVSAWSRALGEMAGSLAAVPGRKHVIYFAEGFDGELLLGRRGDPGSFAEKQALLDRTQGALWMIDNDELTGNTSLQGDVGEMLAAFRRSDCVIQAVDIGGLRGSESELRRRASKDALFFLANETGGELFEDANDLGRQLERLLDHTAVTYTLSFEPEGLALDGEYHEIEVRLPGHKGLRLSHRPGYFAPRPYPEMHPLEKSLLASEAIAAATPRAEIGLQVLAAPFRAGEAAAYVPVILEVDGATLVAGQDGEAVAVEIFAYATNAQGEMRDFFAQALDVAPGALDHRLLATGLKYYGHLELESGDHLLRVLVRNTTTGRVGVATLPLAVPRYDPPSPQLLPPFFFEETDKWLLVREPTPGGDTGSVIYPFTVDGDPYVPAARPVIAGGETAELCLVAYDLGPGAPALQAWLEDAAGNREPGGELFLVERTVTGIAGVDKLRASFRPRHVAAGSYLLTVAVVDAAGGTTTQASIPIDVVR